MLFEKIEIQIVGLRAKLVAVEFIFYPKNSFISLYEFVDKIPRTLLRITDKSRAALLDYTSGMKQVLDELG
jgi:hypothetical protein